jgi:Icc-related predicted phosphoesterase
MWGSPVTPMYGGAFGLSSAVDRKRLYARIPWDIDVLVSHGPPFGILDTARVKPKLHVFGHIHTAYGVFRTEHTIFINAARLGLHDAADKPPFVLQITRR